jgi:hypothetical protein
MDVPKVASNMNVPKVASNMNVPKLVPIPLMRLVMQTLFTVPEAAIPAQRQRK